MGDQPRECRPILGGPRSAYIRWAGHADVLPKNWTSENWKNRLACSPPTREGSHEVEQVFGGADCDGLAACGRGGPGARGDAQTWDQRSHVLRLAGTLRPDSHGRDSAIAAAGG